MVQIGTIEPGMLCLFMSNFAVKRYGENMENHGFLGESVI